MSARNIRLVRKMIESVNKGSVKGFSKLFSKDLTGLVQKGVKENRRAFPDLYYDITKVEARGSEVHFCYVATGTNKGRYLQCRPTRRCIQWEGRAVAEVHRGVINRVDVVEDQYGKLVKLGLTKAVPSVKGRWTTSALGIKVRLQLKQSGTTVSGLAKFQGEPRSFAVSGANLFPKVTLSAELDKDSTLTFTGEFSSARTIKGDYSVGDVSGSATLRKGR